MRINEVTPDQAVAVLDYLRSVLATWSARRPGADQVAGRMVSTSNMPTAAEYAVALHTTDVLAFTGAMLDKLYAGIMHSMPVYRLYSATPEREAIEPPKPRKKVLDPSIITTKRPQDMVRDVMKQTGYQPHDGANA